MPNIRWFNQSAESFEPDCQYSIVVAAEILHWMEWDVVVPKLERALAPSGALAIVTVRHINGLPWVAQLQPLIARFTTNRGYRAYDIVEELVS